MIYMYTGSQNNAHERLKRASLPVITLPSRRSLASRLIFAAIAARAHYFVSLFIQ